MRQQQSLTRSSSPISINKLVSKILFKSKWNKTFHEFITPVVRNHINDTKKILSCDWCSKKVGYKTSNGITVITETAMVGDEELVHVCGKEVFCQDHVIEHIRYVPCKYIP